MSDANDIEYRRQRVRSLRLRDMSEAAIASICNVSTATVSTDLKWIAKNWRDRYGPAPIIDPSEEIGETLDLYKEIQTLALLEHSRIGDETTRVCPRCDGTQVELPPPTNGTKATPCYRCRGNGSISVVVSPMFAARQRMVCLRTAMYARQLRMELLANHNLLDSSLGGAEVLPRAADIMAAFQKAKARGERPTVISDAERLALTTTVPIPEATPLEDDKSVN